MTSLVWDEIGDRFYETGLDRGVLYLPDGSAVPWNGLTSITESSDKESTEIYYDGMKINDLITLGGFKGVMRALTYPKEFSELEGLGIMRSGMFIGQQKPQTFGLSYRTQIGNDVEGDDAGYKIHILYNVTAIPNDVVYDSKATDIKPVEFEWNISAVPEELSGFSPTAHFIINSIDINPDLLVIFEEILYGSDLATPYLPSLSDLVDIMQSVYIIEIIDNEDGTWTANSEDNDDIVMLTADTFQINRVHVVSQDASTFEISSTFDETDIT